MKQIQSITPLPILERLEFTEYIKPLHIQDIIT